MDDTTRHEDDIPPSAPTPPEDDIPPTIREAQTPTAAPTIREARTPAAAPTMREAQTPTAAPTMHEAPSSLAPASLGAGSGPLPDQLADSYRLVRQLASGGGEATLFEVAEVATDEVRVLKIYHRHVALRGEALLRIQSIDPAHVVHLVDHGQLEDGRWYEVQERIDAGNLVDYRSSAAPTESGLAEVVAELADAVAAFHRAGLAHHDIKPENVLVRSISPLDLVLGDFGLSVVSDNSTYYATNRHATIAYQAPETMRHVGGGARDYWAVGLTVAMLATGETPYAGLNEHAILDQHYNKIPPAVVESMPEGRLKQLCRGLTRYDPKSRWSEPEVRSWLRGNDPAVVPDEPRRPDDAAPVVHFNSKRFAVPSALAREILECWALAAETVGVKARRDKFMDELILAFGTESLARLARRWRNEPPRRDSVDASIVELLLTLDPEVPAIYRSRPLDADTVAAAALGDSEDDARFVRDLRDRGLLTAWSHGAGRSQLGDIDRRWQEELERASGIVARASTSGAAAPPVEVWAAPLLAVCARRELLDDWERQRSASRPTGELVPGWYEQIANGSSPADVVGAVLLASEAHRIQRYDLEARRRRLEADRRARRDRRYRRLQSPAGWAAAAAFVGSWVLEFTQTVGADYEREPGAWFVVYALAFALVRQWRNAAAEHRPAPGPGGPLPAARALLRGDDLSASRRAEAYGLLALVLAAEWARTTSISPPLVRLLMDGSLDAEILVQDGYKLAGIFSVTWSLLSFLHRREDGPPTDEEVERLRGADRRTLAKTAVLTAVWALVAVFADAVPSIGLPVICGGMCMLVRGRWPHRRSGTVWAVVLLVAGTTALLAGLFLAPS